MAFIRNVDKLIEGLENKFFTEQRAKDALAPELAAEEAAREAGDSAEAAARQSADNALSGRLDVIEGSGEGSVAKAEQDAKDYADQKVAALVNSAPEVLDTLKELSDALGSDPNFATTVANNIGAVDAKVDQEILDRQSAVSAEQSARESADQALDGRLDLLEADSVTKAYVDGEVSDLQGQITQEISDRQSAVSSEQSARELADSNLSGRISVLEQDPTTKAYVDGEISDLQGQITQEISDRQSAVSSEQSRAQSAEQALDGRLDILEQDPTTKSYVDGEVLDLQGQITQEISDRQSDVNAEETRAMSAEAALDGRIDILEQDPTTKAYVDQEVSAEESRAMLAEQGLQSDIDAEEVRAMAAESALDSRIDVLEQDPTTKAYVDGKVVMLQGEVDSEESRAMSAEQALDGRLDVLEQDPVTKSYVDGEMSSEEQRAMSAEAALDGRLDVLEQDPTTKSYVDGEVSNLQGQVNTEKGRIDAILLASDADKDSFAEIVQLINSVDTSNDNAFASYVLSNDAALAQEISDRQADVNAEESRAMAAEGLLDGRLDVLESDPTTKTYVDSEVSAEESRAMAAEALLDGRLDVLETDPTTKTYVDGQISSEQSARQSADNALDARLDIVEGADTVVGSIAKSLKDAKAYADGLNTTEANARSAEDLTMFKKDGSRQLAGNLLFSAETFDIGAAAANRPNNIYVKNSIVTGTGWAGAPSITFSEAPTTGMFYNSVSSALGFSFDGADKFSIFSWANVSFQSLQMNGSGVNFVWANDGSGDIGASTNYRPNNIYVKNSIVNAGSESIGTTLTMAGASNANMLWTTDGGGSIGASGASRPNNIYAKNDITAGRNLTISGSTYGTSAQFTGTLTTNSLFSAFGGQRLKYSAKAVNYTLSNVSDYIVGVTDVSVSRVMTLPVAGTIPTTQAIAGQILVIKDMTGSASQTKYIQILPQSGQLIDGQADYKIVMPYESVMLMSNGTNWFII